MADGNRRPRSNGAEGNREVQSKRDITVSKTGCYDPFSSTSSSPSFCSLSDQLLLIKILAANLPGCPSSSPPRPPYLSLSSLCHVAPSLPPPLKTCCHQRLKHLVFSLSSHLLCHLSTYTPLPFFLPPLSKFYICSPVVSHSRLTLSLSSSSAFLSCAKRFDEAVG